MNSNQIDHLISKYLSGEISSEEQNEFRLWINSNYKNREEFNKIALIYQLSKVKSNHENKSKALDKLNQRIEQNRSVKLNRYYSNFSIKTWAAIAASILIFVGIGFFYNRNYAGRESIVRDRSERPSRG